MPYEIELTDLRMTDLPSDSSFNTQVIVDAISALSGGGRLIAPGGVMYFDPLPEITKPISLVGKGGFETGGTVWRSDANAVLIPLGPSSPRSHIQHISFRGRRTDPITGNPINPNQTLFQVRSRVYLENIRIGGMGKHGILWRMGTGSLMQKVDIENCGNSGEKEAEEVLGGLTTIRRINCTVAGCGGHGREVTASGGHSYGVGNLITGCTGYAIVMERVSRYKEIGLYCEGNVGDAYLTVDSHHCQLYFQSMQGVVQNFGMNNTIGYEG